MVQPRASSRRVLLQTLVRAARRAALVAGNRMDISMLSTAITTSSSTSVKPKPYAALALAPRLRACRVPPGRFAACNLKGAQCLENPASPHSLRLAIGFSIVSERHDKETNRGTLCFIGQKRFIGQGRFAATWSLWRITNASVRL
jgi:hypothetical protein